MKLSVHLTRPYTLAGFFLSVRFEGKIPTCLHYFWSAETATMRWLLMVAKYKNDYGMAGRITLNEAPFPTSLMA
jgi:hypothetical protein